MRLYFFSGYGLGDDSYFAGLPLSFVDTWTLDFTDHRLNRPLLVLPQILAFLVLPINDHSFVLPILVFALGTHAVSMFLARDVLGERGALFTSLFFLTCPFETLSSTAFVPDYLVAFYTVASVWCCHRGHRSGGTGRLALGGLLLGCALLSKESAILITPVIGLATVLTPRRWKGWLAYWASFAAVMLAAELAFWLLAGNPVARFTERPWGHDVTSVLGVILSIYPRYLLWMDLDTGHWMFGWTGLAGVAGLLAGSYRVIGRRADERDVIMLLCLIYLLVFNLAPHRIDFTAYYSHPRIFRYLAQISPFVYIGAAFLAELLCARDIAGRIAAGVLVAALCGFGAYETPPITEPSRDPNSDGRVLSRFFRENPPPPVATINADGWNCQRLRDMNHSQAGKWDLRCGFFSTDAQKQDFLTAIDHGYVITGGGSLGWYSNRPWVLNLSELGFDPPAAWELLLEVDTPVRPWRKEPLRIWRVADPLARSTVPIRDAKLAECLRSRVYPLRPEDGLARDRPITERLAQLATTIECQDSGIRDASGIEAFVNLTTLNLGGNQLETLDVRALTKLEVLILGHNRLASVPGLPGLTGLRVLWLGYNQLRSVDVSGLERLEDLRVDGNGLVSLVGVGDLTGLQWLFLGGNPALDCGSLDLPEALLDASGCGR